MEAVMLKMSKRNKTAENEILKFLDKCERFGGEKLTDCSVDVSFQRVGLNATTLNLRKGGRIFLQIEFPYISIFKVERFGKYFPVCFIDNRNIEKIYQGE